MFTVAPTSPVTVPSTFSPTRFRLSRPTGKSKSCWWNGRAEVGVGEEPEVVDPALREHLVEGRVGLVGVHAGIAPDVRERDVEVGVPQLEHRHEDHQRGDGDQHRVDQERAAGARSVRPLVVRPGRFTAAQ